MAVVQAQPIGDIAHDPAGDIDRLLTCAQGQPKRACGEPVLAGKDGAEHGCRIPDAPEP